MICLSFFLCAYRGSILNSSLVAERFKIHRGHSILDILTLSGPEDFDRLKGRGGLIQPAGKRWPLEASEATVEATKQTNIVPDIFLYL